MTKLHLLLSLGLLLMWSCMQSAHAQCAWNSGATGNWSDGTKWSCGHPPLSSDNVSIASGTITLDVSPTVTDFSMTGGTLTGTNDLTLSGNLSMSNGVLGNTGDVSVAGTFAWSGGNIGKTDGSTTGTVSIAGATTLSTNNTKGLYAKTLNLNGGGSQVGGGSVLLAYSCTINLAAGQTFVGSVASSWLTTSGGGTINNAGTLEKQGTGELAISAAFNNTGSLSVTGGAVKLAGGGTHAGSFSHVATTTLEFGGGTHNLSASTISGAGTLEVSAGTVTLPTHSTHADVVVSNGTAHFSGDNTMQDLTIGSGTLNLAGTLAVQDLTFNGGAAGNISGTCPITASGNLSMSNGVLGNTGDVSVAGTFAWSGGNIGKTDGSTTGTVSIAGATTLSTNNTKGLYAKTLNLNGGGSQVGGGSINLAYSCTINLAAGQTFVGSVASSWLTTSGGGTINNEGTLEKQGSGELSISAAFNNTGSLSVTGGAVKLAGGGTHTGSFSHVATTTLEFGGGTHNLSASTISGAGTLEVSAGTVTLPTHSTHADVVVSNGTAHFSGDNTMQDLTIGSGTLNLAGTLAVQDLTFNGGAAGNISGTCPITASGNLSMSNGVLGNTGDVSVAGTFTWSGGNIGKTDGSTTGAVSIAGATTLSSNNAKGLYAKTLNLNGGGSQVSGGSVLLAYSCTMNLAAGQTFVGSIASNWFTTSGGGNINNAGTFEKQGTGELAISAAFNNTGSLSVAGGVVNLTGGGTHAGSFSHVATTTLEFGGGTHNLSASTISGAGTLEVSAGTVTLPTHSTHADVVVSNGTAHFSGDNTMQDLTVGSGTLNLAGTLAVQDLTFNGGSAGNISGTCPITASGNLSMSNGVLGNTGDVSVAGTFAWSGGNIGKTDGSTTGAVSIAGATTLSTNNAKGLYAKTLNLNGGGSQVGGGSVNFAYSCTMNLAAGQTFVGSIASNWFTTNGGGTINNEGTFQRQGSGTLTLASIFNNNGVIAGSGILSLTGTFNNNGLISPGTSTGLLNLNKTTGITLKDLAIELEGTGPGAGGYDQLNNTSGAINLSSGTLTVTLLNGYLPTVGTSFIIATGTSRTGGFGALDLPVDNSFWAITYNPTNVVITVASPLPVEWLGFEVKKERGAIQLLWSVAMEYNNRGFNIERSIDGRQFEAIGFVGSKGDSHSPTFYHFTDLAAPLLTTLYYRLQQEDYDGQLSYSPIRTLVVPISEQFVLAPNPIVETTYLQLFLPDDASLSAYLTNIQGQLCGPSYTTSLPAGAQSIPLYYPDLPAGTYFLNLQINQNRHRLLLIKQ